MRTRRPVGRPPLCSDEVRAAIVRLRQEGKSLREIATYLNGAGYKTPSGKDVWSRNMVHDLLSTRHVREYADA